MSSPARTANIRRGRLCGCHAGAVTAGLVAAALAGCTITVNNPSESQLDSPASESLPPAPVTVPSSADWPDLIETISSGVVLIRSTGCSGVMDGTGFLVAEDQVFTAAHVVDGAQELTVETASGQRTGSVLGIDRSGDLALIGLEAPVSGHLFNFSEAPPRQGEEILGLGYPLGSPNLVTTDGRISSVGQSVVTETTDRTDMIQTDAGLNPGNSGGPVVLPDGSVVGIVSAGLEGANVTNFAVPAAAAAAKLPAWRSAVVPVDFPACDITPTGPQGSLVTVTTSDRGAAEVADLIDIHGRAINARDFVTAYADFTPKMQEHLGDRASWTARFGDVQWIAARVVGVETRADGAYLADVELARTGDPSVGGECFVWTKHYVIKEAGGLRIGWVEDRADPYPCTDW